MKKALIAAALMAVGAFALQAAESCIIKGLDDRDLQVDEIKALPSGDLEYVSGPSKIKSKIQKGKYKWAWIPKPKEVSDADADLKGGKLQAAADKYKKAFEAYKILGWDVYCAAKEAECLAGLNQKPEAIKRLVEFKSYKPANPKLDDDLMDAFKLLAVLYIETGDDASASPLLDEMGKSKDEDIAAFSFNKKGDIFNKQGNKKDAVLLYLQTALLFPKSSARPEALLKTANILAEMKDPRGAKFAEMLKSEYPSDPMTKQLK